MSSVSQINIYERTSQATTATCSGSVQKRCGGGGERGFCLCVKRKELQIVAKCDSGEAKASAERRTRLLFKIYTNTESSRRRLLGKKIKRHAGFE